MFKPIVAFFLLSAPLPLAADPFIGDFVGGYEGVEIRLSLGRAGDGRYVGKLSTYEAELPLAAERRDDMLVGQINDGGELVGFLAAARAGALVLKFEDGETLAFRAAAGAATDATGRTAAGTRAVFVNRVALADDVLRALEVTYQTRVEDGRYWYDAASGAWGVEGGPTAGFIAPGLGLPGPIPADISGGGTGIFINGREIHPLDQAGLRQLFGVTYPGHYWLDASGNLGPVGGPAIVNIVAAVQQAQAAQSGQSGGSVTHGYGSAYGARGTVGGGMYSGRTASGKSVFWYPGM
ncbi:MAG: hypothetical protein R3286_02820 [Gammaproteobacteria bacterium]|nr:hypothetical protein [Gammaproteobacteria bacterium]